MGIQLSVCLNCLFVFQSSSISSHLGLNPGILVHYSQTLRDTVNISPNASSEFGTYRLCEQRRFRRACASAQSRQNLRCSLIQAVNQEEPSDKKPDPWPLWMAGHARLKFVMTECSKTQIRLAGLIYEELWPWLLSWQVRHPLPQRDVLLNGVHHRPLLLVQRNSYRLQHYSVASNLNGGL